MDNLIMIASVEAQHAAEEKAGESIEVRARAAMEAVQRHWLVTDKEKQFLAACEGLARTCTEDELERVEADLRKLSRASALIGALQSGVAVDWDAMADEAEAEEASPGPEPLGLRKMWQEVCLP